MAEPEPELQRHNRVALPASYLNRPAEAHRQRLGVSEERRRHAASSSSQHGGGGGDHDYAQAGRELLQRVNLELDGAPERYAPANPIWRHPDSGGTLFVGNASIAGDRQALAQLRISRIVFCQDSDGRMTFAKDPAFKYLKFSIGWAAAAAPLPPSSPSLVDLVIIDGSSSWSSVCPS
jgi:hypothetical protein